MSDINQVKSEIKSYFSKTRRNKAEWFRFAIIALFAYLLTIIFTSSFDSSLGYDIRSEFSGYLIILSFFSFLFIDYKHSSHGLKLLSFCHVIVCIANFLIIKSVIVPFLIKLFICYAAIFLLLVVLREIKNRA
jgi:hypothetical protein